MAIHPDIEAVSTYSPTAEAHSAAADRAGAKRRIDLPPFPIGWFAIAFSGELTPGEVVPKTFCGQEVVLFRESSGRAAVLDAYCPHLGAHLGFGSTVSEGGLRCPFHGWQWSPEGKCVNMPYGGRISPGAKTRSWPVAEQDEVILVWNGAEAPTWQMPAFSDRRWTAPRTMVRQIRSHPQEILENSVDFAHFRFVHRTHMMKATAEPYQDGPVFDVRVEADPQAVEASMQLPDDILLDGSAVCHGPGLGFASLSLKGMSTGLQRLYATPIDGEIIELRGVVTLEVSDDSDDQDAYLNLLAEQVIENWAYDINIWANKCYQAKPLLNRSERLIPEFRRWYSQFYTGGAHDEPGPQRLKRV